MTEFDNKSAKAQKTHLNMNGIFNFGGTVSPKKLASSAILHKTLRTISPKYMPEMIFSKICKHSSGIMRIYKAIYISNRNVELAH